MKQTVLKALSNPPRIFYVPYTLAIFNFIFCFVCFVVSMLVFLLTTKDIPMMLPMIFLGIIFVNHSILAFFSKKEQQLTQIIFSWLNIFLKKIPRRLAV